jgi:hypothetical protein
MRTRRILAVAVLVTAAVIQQNPASAAQGSVTSPNGMVGIQQQVVLYAPGMPGQTATIGLTSGATQQVLQTSVNAQGYGYANWTPTTAGAWTINALGSAASSGSTTISVAAMPTSTAIEVPNNAQTNTAVTVLATVTAAAGGIAPTGTMTLRSFPSQNIIATSAVNPVGASTSSLATFTWTPTGIGTASLVASFTPDTGAFGASTSSVGQSAVSTAVSIISLAFPAQLNLGQPTVLSAILGANQPQGTAAFLFDGQGISASIPTVNGVANFVWTPPTTGVHTIGVNYSSSTNVSGSSFQPVTIQGPLPKDTITVDPQPGAPWFIASPITLQAGTSVTLSGVAASGAPVVFSENGPCILNGVALTALSPGQCQVTAFSPGSASYTQASQTYTVTVTAPPRRGR